MVMIRQSSMFLMRSWIRGHNMRLDIKPFSVNGAWQGRRYPTKEYKSYTEIMMYILKPCKIPPGYLDLNLKFGFSSASSDIDNPVKCFIDCLQKKYGFNDKMIKHLTVEVEDVKKGNEFIDWNISVFTPNS